MLQCVKSEHFNWQWCAKKQVCNLWNKWPTQHNDTTISVWPQNLGSLPVPVGQTLSVDTRLTPRLLQPMNHAQYVLYNTVYRWSTLPSKTFLHSLPVPTHSWTADVSWYFYLATTMSCNQKSHGVCNQDSLHHCHWDTSYLHVDHLLTEPNLCLWGSVSYIPAGCQPVRCVHLQHHQKTLSDTEWTCPCNLVVHNVAATPEVYQSEEEMVYVLR